MFYKNIHFIILIIIIFVSIVIPSEKITKIEEILLDVNLDSGWSAGYNISCDTGYGTYNKTTTVKTSHCSCFVYALCKKLGFYIPSPPEYSQFHLADKQLEWIESSDGISNGWTNVGLNVPDCYIEAQRKANEGYFVIVGVTQDDMVNGHIGVVRPYRNVDYKIISKRGPIVIASSIPNTYASFLDDEFRLNEKKFSHLNGRVMFYYNTRKPI